MINGRGLRPPRTVGRGSISVVSVLLAFPKLLLFSSLGGAFFAPIGVVSSSAKPSSANSASGLARHPPAQSSTLTRPESVNIFAKARPETQLGADSQGMSSDASAPDEAGVQDTPEERFGSGGFDGAETASTGPEPPPAMMVHIKGAAPPSMWNVPNVITMARVVAIPVFATLFYASLPRRNVWCSAIFAGAAFTDWLDGFIARKQGIVTAFGAFLDPVADKLMVSTALILLSQRLGPWMTICAAIILCRELTISALREWMAQLGMRDTVKVGNAGKWKAATQMVAISLLLLLEPGAIETLVSVQTFLPLAKGLLLLSTVLTVTSGSGYLSAAWPYLSGRAKQDSANAD